jgi:hypothetical protein
MPERGNDERRMMNDQRNKKSAAARMGNHHWNDSPLFSGVPQERVFAQKTPKNSPLRGAAKKGTGILNDYFQTSSGRR